MRLSAGAGALGACKAAHVERACRAKTKTENVPPGTGAKRKRAHGVAVLENFFAENGLAFLSGGAILFVRWAETWLHTSGPGKPLGFFDLRNSPLTEWLFLQGQTFLHVKVTYDQGCEYGGHDGGQYVHKELCH